MSTAPTSPLPSGLEPIAESSLLALIRELRQDLCTMFPLHSAEDWYPWLGWLITAGVKEYRALLESPVLRQVLAQPGPHGVTQLQWLTYHGRPDVQAAYPLPEQRDAYLAWFYRHGVEEHCLWPFLTEDELRSLQAQEPQPAPLALQARPFGVNLIGYAFGQLGIGEDLRMAARALHSQNLPFTVINFPPGDDIPQNDRSLADRVQAHGDYAINLFCLTAGEHGRFYAERGAAQLAGRYNIGYWPWELSRWPLPWHDINHLVDEAWVSTRHTFDALSPIALMPVQYMPMAVELGPISPLGRCDFGLPEHSTLFCFSFDLNSSIHRKNPQAGLAAFQRAFPIGQGDDVGLVIKCHPPKAPHREWERLKALAQADPRIHIVERTLSRPDLLALYRVCDCFLSLHRAEGFGRGLAEALLLGLHLIATGYSGNLDFCQPPHSSLVRYRLIPVGPDDYPYSQGQVWAEPDLDHAAKLMQAFARQPKHAASAFNGQRFSATQVGQSYKDRLQRIYRWIQQGDRPWPRCA